MNPTVEHDEPSVLTQMREQIAATAMPATERPLLARVVRARPRVLAGASVGLGAASAAAVLALAGVSSPPAFAVSTGADGSVTITLNSLSAVGDLNAKLAAAGLHVRVAEVVPGCNAPVQLAGSTAAPATLQATPGAGASAVQLSLTADPGAGAVLTNVPDGDTLVLAASQSGLEAVGQIAQSDAPACVGPGQ